MHIRISASQNVGAGSATAYPDRIVYVNRPFVRKGISATTNREAMTQPTKIHESPPTDGNITKRRLQFEFSAEAYEELLRMKKEHQAQSFAELVRNALRLYDWFKKQQNLGYELGLVKDDKVVKEVKLFF